MNELTRALNLLQAASHRATRLEVEASAANSADRRRANNNRRDARRFAHTLGASRDQLNAAEERGEAAALSASTRFDN